MATKKTRSEKLNDLIVLAGNAFSEIDKAVTLAQKHFGKKSRESDKLLQAWSEVNDVLGKLNELYDESV